MNVRVREGGGRSARRTGRFRRVTLGRREWLAAHVLVEVQKVTGRFAIALGGQLFAVLRDRFVTPTHHAADIGLIPIRSEVAAFICECGGRFLDADMIDETENADGADVLNTLANSYFAVGFPASRSQSRILHREKQIKLKTYGIRLTLAPSSDYRNGFSKDHHVLLEYPQKEILLAGRPANPPRFKA